MERIPQTPDRHIPFSHRVKSFDKFMLEEIGKLDMNPQRQPVTPPPRASDIVGLAAQVPAETKPLPGAD